ncbi:MAG: hypothetical protein AAFX87_03155 [Bacteroidota bacterium]
MKKLILCFSLVFFSISIGLAQQKTYIVKRIIDLRQKANVDLMESAKLTDAIYQAGTSGDVKAYYHKDRLWKDMTLLDKVKYDKGFKNEMDASLFTMPIASIHLLNIVEEVKLDPSGNKTYEIKYIGLSIDAEKTITGIQKDTGYLPFENLKKVLKKMKGSKGSYYDLIAKRKLTGTTSISVTNQDGINRMAYYDKYQKRMVIEDAPEGFDLEAFAKEVEKPDY